MPTKPNERRTFIVLVTERGSCSYNEGNKRNFHRLGKKILKEIADLMGLKPSEYDLRSNQGGIAVSGEVTLHTETLYVQFSQFVSGCGEILYRRCDGRKDYCGKRNQWMAWTMLEDLQHVADIFQRAAAEVTSV